MTCRNRLSKEPYFYMKETPIYTKEPHVYTTEPYVYGKKMRSFQKDVFIYDYILLKYTRLMTCSTRNSNETYFYIKRALCICKQKCIHFKKNCVFKQKRQIYIQKSRMYVQKKDVFISKICSNRYSKKPYFYKKVTPMYTKKAELLSMPNPSNITPKPLKHKPLINVNQNSDCGWIAQGWITIDI